MAKYTKCEAPSPFSFSDAFLVVIQNVVLFIYRTHILLHLTQCYRRFIKNFIGVYSFYVTLGFIKTIFFRYTRNLDHIHPILTHWVPTLYTYTSVYLLGCTSINVPSVFPSLADFTYGGIDYTRIIAQSISAIVILQSGNSAPIK